MTATANLKIVLRETGGSCWLVFDRPVDVLSARTPHEVIDVLTRVERRVRGEGLYAAGYVTYEAAPGFDAALTTRPHSRLPLVCFGLFAEPRRVAGLPEVDAGTVGPVGWQMTTTRQQYLEDFKQIKHEIELGNTYQINYTVRKSAERVPDPWDLFRLIAADAPGGAFVDGDGYAIVSASPELFFSLDSDDLLCRPMKGTAARGMTDDDDRMAGSTLQASAKNRAENVMITDMIRNDLGRVALPGSVITQSLFDVERHPTLWQMTSTVTAKTSAPITEIFRALFPCASVTGAPKRSSMAIIARLEDSPREVYTGSIGYFGPARQAQFNVAIRTVWVDKESYRGTYGVGGGIVWDSEAEDEYRECLVKSTVLTSPPRDRGFQLLETMRWSPAEGYFLLEHHLNRLRKSAAYFNFTLDTEKVVCKLDMLAAQLDGERFRIRLLLDRHGDLRLTSTPISRDPDPAICDVILAADPVDTSDPFLYNKTTRRDMYSEALRTAGECDDVLLWNADGYITETTIANVIVRQHGEWLTPPVSCGLLGGTYREWLLQNGEIRERQISIDDLASIDELVLINSVRGRFAARLIGDGRAGSTGTTVVDAAG